MLTKNRLALMLDDHGSSSARACCQALSRGSGFAVGNTPVLTSHLLAVCRRRETIFRILGVEAVGFGQAVERLRATHERSVLVVGIADGATHHSVIVSVDLSRVVTCFSVTADRASVQTFL